MSRTPTSRARLAALIGAAALTAAVFATVAEASPVPASPPGTADPVLAPSGGNDSADPCHSQNTTGGQAAGAQCTGESSERAGDRHRHRHRHRHGH